MAAAVGGDPEALLVTSAVDLTMAAAEAPDLLDYADRLPGVRQPQTALGGLLAGDGEAGGGRLKASEREGGGGGGSGRVGAAASQPPQDPTVTLSDLGSIQELLTEVEEGAHRGLIEIFKGHTFVGMASLS